MPWKSMLGLMLIAGLLGGCAAGGTAGGTEGAGEPPRPSEMNLAGDRWGEPEEEASESPPMASQPLPPPQPVEEASERGEAPAQAESTETLTLGEAAPASGTEADSDPDPGAGAARTWTVQRGDTLWKIAVSIYGEGRAWRRIAEANGIEDPSAIRVGRELVLP